jgi:hypothetical protein
MVTSLKGSSYGYSGWHSVATAMASSWLLAVAKLIHSYS